MNMYNPERVTYIAETDFRSKKTKFGIKAKDRTRHMYVIGKTGMGKSTLLENMAVQDIQNGEGFAFIDPHGGTAEKLLDYIPPERINDVIYFAPFDTEYPISFNIMEDVGRDKRHLVANGLLSALKKLFQDQFSARMEYILSNTILALLEYPGSTLLSINKMYTDKEFRKKVVDNVSDPTVRAFWVDEFAKYTDTYVKEATPAIQNKVGQFVSNPIIRNIVGQPKSSFDVREIMDSGKILIVNLSKGRMGEQNANLIGSILITKIYLSAMSRADLSPGELATKPNFYFYVDEFQSFANESFADILSEARKYKLNLTIAHQYVEQMPEEVRAAVFGNVGTMITFRIGSYDAEIFEKEFAPTFTSEDLVNLSQYQAYMKLMIDGVTSRPFSATGMAPIPMPIESQRDKVIENSRRQYARPRADIEQEVNIFHDPNFGKEKIDGNARPQGSTGGSAQGNFQRNAGASGAQGGRDRFERREAPQVRREERVEERKQENKPFGKELEKAFQERTVPQAPQTPKAPQVPKAPEERRNGGDGRVSGHERGGANKSELKSALLDILGEVKKEPPKPVVPSGGVVPEKKREIPPPQVEKRDEKEEKKDNGEVDPNTLKQVLE